MIDLGDRVKDRISGISGIVIAITDWLYGCRRYCIQPETAKDGKPAETFTVDEPQLVLVKKSVIENKSPRQEPPKQEAPVRRHGARPEPVRRNDATR